MLKRSLAPLMVISLAASVAACGITPTAYTQSVKGGSAEASKAKRRAPVVAGDLRLHVLPDAQDTFLIQALNGAKKSIKLQVYLLTHQGVIDALLAANTRGLDVQVMLEEKPYNPGNPNSPLPTNKVAAKKLAAGGLTIKWTNPVFKYTHAKSVTIDDQVTFVSTANFTKSGLGVGGIGAREYIVEDRSPSDVSEFVGMFKADWAHAAYTPADPDIVASPVNARAKIFDLVRSAKQSITLQVEVAGDPALDALIATKVSEGVKVRALLADLPALKSKEGEAHRGNKEVAQAWLKAGADVRYQAAPHLHAKAIVVDRRASYVGSVNMTTNSMDNNRELGLILTAAPLVNEVFATFERDFGNAEVITPAGLSKRPMKPFLFDGTFDLY